MGGPWVWGLEGLDGFDSGVWGLAQDVGGVD